MARAARQPPREVETLTRLPAAQEGRAWALPFPPESEVVTVWRDGEPVSSRLATEEDRAAFAPFRRVTPADLARARELEQAAKGPSAEAVAALIRRIEEAPPPPVRTPPTEEELRAERVRECLWRARRAGVPAKYLDALRAPEDRPAMRWVKNWARSGKQALLLHGANQAGKSVAAAAWLSTQERGLWTSGEELGLLVQPDPEHKSIVRLRALREAGALVIDDAMTRCGPAGYEQMEALIIRHLGAGHRVIVTADCEAEDFHRLFGDEHRNRIRSRWDLNGQARGVGPWETT